MMNITDSQQFLSSFIFHLINIDEDILIFHLNKEKMLQICDNKTLNKSRNDREKSAVKFGFRDVQ